MWPVSSLWSGWCFNPHWPLGASATYSDLDSGFWMYQFQSSLAPRGQCYSADGCVSGMRSSFNPHWPLGASATSPVRPKTRFTGCFNPHWPLGASATTRSAAAPHACTGFNPHWPLGASATCGHLARAADLGGRGGGGAAVRRFRRALRGRAACFNPHWPLGASATRLCGVHGGDQDVSILTGP